MLSPYHVLTLAAVYKTAVDSETGADGRDFVPLLFPLIQLVPLCLQFLKSEVFFMDLKLAKPCSSSSLPMSVDRASSACPLPWAQDKSTATPYNEAPRSTLRAADQQQHLVVLCIHQLLHATQISQARRNKHLTNNRATLRGLLVPGYIPPRADTRHSKDQLKQQPSPQETAWIAEVAPYPKIKG